MKIVTRAPEPSAAARPYSQTMRTCAPPSPPNSTMKIVTRAPPPSRCSRIYSQTMRTCAPPSPPNSTMKIVTPRAEAIRAARRIYSQTMRTCALPSPPNSTIKIVACAPKPSARSRNLLPDHADLCAAVAAKLDDENWLVRATAISALAGLAIYKVKAREMLRPAINMDNVHFSGLSPQNQPRTLLAKYWGEWAAQDPAGRAEARAMLLSEDWRLRQSGAEILVAVGK